MVFMVVFTIGISLYFFIMVVFVTRRNYPAHYGSIFTIMVVFLPLWYYYYHNGSFDVVILPYGTTTTIIVPLWYYHITIWYYHTTIMVVSCWVKSIT